MALLSGYFESPRSCLLFRVLQCANKSLKLLKHSNVCRSPVIVLVSPPSSIYLTSAANRKLLHFVRQAGSFLFISGEKSNTFDNSKELMLKNTNSVQLQFRKQVVQKIYYHIIYTHKVKICHFKPAVIVFSFLCEDLHSTSILCYTS